MRGFAPRGPPPCNAKSCSAARASISISILSLTSGKTSSWNATTCPNAAAARSPFWCFWLRMPTARCSATPAPICCAAIRPMPFSVSWSSGRKVTAVFLRTWSSIPASPPTPISPPESDGHHLHDPAPPVTRLRTRNGQPATLGLANRATRCPPSHLSDAQGCRPADPRQPLSGPGAPDVHCRSRPRATHGFAHQRPAHFRRQAHHSLCPTHVDRKLPGRLSGLLSPGRTDRGSSPPGSSRRAGGYSPVLRLTADEMSPPLFPCPKKFTFWDTTLLPRGTFWVRVRAGPLADAPRPFSSCSPAAPRRKMRDRLPKDIALFTVHFEMLTRASAATSANPASDIMPTSLVREEKISVSDLESFAIQEQLSGQMAYLTLMVSGLARFETGDWSRAITRFSQAIEAPEPEGMIGSEVVYLYRGTAHGMLRHEAEGDANLTKCIKINPKLSEAFNNRRYIRGFIRQKPDLDCALCDFTRAIELNSCFYTALINRGVVLRHKGESAAAVHDYYRAVECDPENYLAFISRSTRNVLLHAAGEQEDFRPLFLPGPPALVLWSGAVPRGLSQSNVRQNATVCIRGEPLSAGSPAGRGFQRRGPKFQPGPGAQPGHPTIFPPPAGGNAPGRRPAATRGARRAGFTTRPAPGDWNDAILRSAARISR